MVQDSADEPKAVVFGGYPDFIHLRDQYDAEEPEDELEFVEAPSRAERQELRRKRRSKLQEDIAQLRLQYNTLLHLVREHFRPETVAASSSKQPQLLSQHEVQYCTSEHIRQLLAERGGWRGLRHPIVFQAPHIRQPFTSRERIVAKDFHSNFPTATVLGDALAAQFGPDWLQEGQKFSQCLNDHCFSQVPGASQKEGPLRDLWESLPDWMRCPMVVMSTGPGGSGVAFHKHSAAWLIVLEGVKHWWLYPPNGPPTDQAYNAFSLCPAANIAEAVEKLPVKDRPIQITQRAGEGVFVPALWWHATYNVGPTLGIGSQYHVFDLDFSKAADEHRESAFVLYHRGCEIHKSDPHKAADLFEEAINREPLNFYYGMNQLRFYLNLVWPPKQTLDVIARLLRSISEGLDSCRQMLVLRFVIPSLFDFVEWNMDYDRLLKYSCEGCRLAFEAVLSLTRQYLPGGDKARLTSKLPHLERLRYTSKCSQCGSEGSWGRPGDPNSIWAHKFFCNSCLEVKEKCQCQACGQINREGQMGHSGTVFAKWWYCAPCWKVWGATPNRDVLRMHISESADRCDKTSQESYEAVD